MPTFNQCKKIHWLPIEYLFTETPLSKLVKSINRSEAIIELHGDRPGIMLAGVNQDEAIRLRGLSIPLFYGDEFGDFKPNLLASLKPAVDRCGGSILGSGTPKGKATWFYKIVRDLTRNHNWNYYHYFTKDNPFLPNIENILAQGKAGLTDREFRCEFEASWEDFEGAIFDCLTSVNVIKRDQLPNQFDQVFLGVDWGDINPACVVIGAKGFPYTYYVLDYFEGNPGGTNTSIMFDDFKRIAGEMANKYRVSTVFPDVFQPGNINFIQEFRASIYPCLHNIVNPVSEDYKRMRTLKVMPSLALMNRLFNQKRFYILDTLEDNFKSAIRKQSKSTGDFLDEVDKSSTRYHLIDASRYVVANVEQTLAILCGHTYLNYGVYDEYAIAS